MLSARDLYLAYGNRTILDHLSLTLKAKDRLALVGMNGAGKSSLLKILAGDIDEGAVIEKNQGLEIAFLRQEPTLSPDLSVNETLLKAMSMHIAAIKEHERLGEEIARQGHATDVQSKELARLLSFIEHKGGFDCDYLKERVLSRLGIRARLEKVGTLSGGERRRLDLACVLLAQPDVFLLDEPTNHLDLEGIAFLVDYLKKSSAALLFISHDQAFIDDIATDIIELDAGKLYRHEPPFANYLENKLIRESIAERTMHKRERLLASELIWLRRGAPARTTKQEARIGRAASLIEQVGKDQDAKKIKQIEVLSAEKKRLGKSIIDIENISFAYGDNLLFENFSLNAVYGERYGIVGANGSGKSTLLSILMGTAEPSSGRVKIGKNTQFLTFDQHREQLNQNATLKESLADHGDYVFVGEQKIHIASYLEKYLFDPSEVKRKVSSLSGGEQNRLMLAQIFRKSANCLVLDEPTNDLDIESLAVLKEIVLEFPGVVFIVSHDRAFIDYVVTQLIVFENNNDSPAKSKITIYPGNFEDYQRLRPKELAKSPDLKEKKEAPKRAKTKRSFKEEKELADIETKIFNLESERDELLQLINSADFFQKDRTLSDKTLSRHKEVEALIESLYKRWQELLDIAQ
jgi:ATP-binding cassette subfamily F protein uup